MHMWTCWYCKKNIISRSEPPSAGPPGPTPVCRSCLMVYISLPEVIAEISAHRLNNIVYESYDGPNARGFQVLNEFGRSRMPPYVKPHNVPLDHINAERLRLVFIGDAWKVSYSGLERLINDGYVNCMGTELTELGRKAIK